MSEEKRMMLQSYLERLETYEFEFISSFMKCMSQWRAQHAQQWAWWESSILTWTSYDSMCSTVVQWEAWYIVRIIFLWKWLYSTSSYNLSVYYTSCIETLISTRSNS
jgi:sensor histidine kinase YesM